MKKLLYSILLITSISYGQKNDALKICLEYQKSVKGFSFEKEADKVLDEILSVIGASKNFSLTQCSEINNALAITFKGERYILYDKAFINKINKMTNDWSGKFILAHEVGHHINGHTRDFLIASQIDKQTKEKQREEELEADEFAGFILAKLGASYSQISELMDVIASEKDDKYSTHPSRDKRLKAIKRGYDKIEIVATKSSIKRKENKKSILSSSWSYRNIRPYDEKINDAKLLAEVRGKLFGPFEVQKFKYHPRFGKESISNGKSIKGDETCKIIITQKKYPNLGGIYNDRRKKFFFGDNAQKFMPFLGIEVKIEGLYDLPKFKALHNFKNPDWKDKFLWEESRAWGGMIGLSKFGMGLKVNVLVDDIYEYSFPVWFDGYVSESNHALKEKIKKLKLEKSDRIGQIDEYDYLILPSAVEWQPYNDDNPDDLIAIKNFIEALKKGKKLYLKLSKEYKNAEGDWETNNSFNSNTYEFDLKGSSKALKFDY